MGDVLVFSSVSSAERYLDPERFRENEYEIYDSEGRALGISIDNQRTRFLFIPINREHVVLKALDKDPQHEARLRELLTEFLKLVLESKQSWEDWSLDQLIQKALQFRTR